MNRSASTPEADAAEIGVAGRLIGETALSLCSAAGRIAEPFAGLLLAERQRRGKEDAARRNERFGISHHKRPPGGLVWVHAASVGETTAILPLAERIAARGLYVLLTTATVSAARMAAGRLPERAMHQYVPIDMPASVSRFLAHWRPDLVLFAESELWPNTVKAVARRNVPLAVVNARMSERSFRLWRKFRPFAEAIISRIDLLLAQSAVDAERLLKLGGRHVEVCGNLKFDAPPPPADERTLAAFRKAIGGRPVLVAASTHAGEEATIIAAHAEIARSGTHLLTVMAPRLPRRGEAVAEEIRAQGLSVRRRALAETIEPATDIYVADTIGEMGLWYRLADVAFLGKSMVPRGGQNPIEPAKLGVPVLHGAHVENFREVYGALATARAVECVRDAATLSAAVKLLLEHPGESRRRAEAARLCVERFEGALERTLQALEPYLSVLAATA